ncbi:MAG: Glycerol-3-phosphate cytidyltransferase [Candidatus Woesebacteria bacterium GW2011_GWB1_39_12]|uniref:Glycerol-3-phosphate cytidyltransferase n=2 Tax=Candidatus Woeseibacteriota TaxID=1752722 RepID=A0A0G0M5Y5_9BACT|nr:MAG: Glycerol-3-phosphate cytidyltransferase [Candidatus Woesebacteria bacterium GW2011_GWA1_39_12]KKR00792.1 MAG: Glycerol-3-phosphate cytidyltransferase [Candidatus Woesebacteria bacterium GW2011_GWB1_39_12]
MERPLGLKVKIGGNEVSIHFLEGNSTKETHPLLQNKLIPRGELASVGDFLRRRGYKLSFTTGVFDMVHIGHARYLELARSLGNVLFVGLNTDESVKRLKGPNRPVLRESERAEMLSFIQFVDYITPFPEDNGAEVIRILKPDTYLCVEGSWEGDIETKAEVIAMTEIGGQVFRTPRQDPFLSTTDIIHKISEQNTQQIISDFQRFMSERNKSA